MKNMMMKTKILMMLPAILLAMNGVLKAQSDTLDLGLNVMRTEQTVSEAITTISGTSLGNIPSSQLTQMLEGQVLGLGLMETNADLQGTQFNTWVRGVSTTSGHIPLVVVDGVMMESFNYDYINPSEIESISLLKDAAATAIYGARGANGVVLIRTRKTGSGKFKVHTFADMSLQQLGSHMRSLTAREYMLMRTQSWVNDGKVGTSPQSLGGEHDWLNELTQPVATMQRAGVAVGGGTKILRVFSAINLMRQGSIIRQSEHPGYDARPHTFRVNFRAKVDVDITSWVSADAQIAGAIGDARRTFNGLSDNDLYRSIMKMPSSLEGPLNDNGYVTTLQSLGESAYGLINRTGYTNLATAYLTTTAGLKFDFSMLTKGLSLSGRVNFQSSSLRYNHSVRTYRSEYYNFTTGQYVQKGSAIDTNLANSVNGNYAYAVSYIASLDYARTFDMHDVQAHLYSYFSERQPNTASADFPALGMSYFSHNLGLNLGYSYAGRYVVNATAGFYSSDEIAKQKRYACTPSVSLAWVISAEDFMASARDAVQLLKLRASYGVVPLDDFSVEGRRYLYEDYIRKNGTLMVIGNPDLGPELRSETNVGFDAKLFGQLSLGLDSYWRKTNNMLISTTTVSPAWLGTSSATTYINAGVMQNRGVELSVAWDKKFGDWGVHAGVQWAHQENKILESGEGAYPASYAYRYHINGYPLGQQWGYLTDGYISTEAELATYTNMYRPIGTPRLGDFKYKDINRDGMVDEKDMAPIGKGTTPTDFTTVTLGFNWTGLEFSLMFSGVNGFYGSTGYATDMEDAGVYNDLHLASWTPYAFANHIPVKSPALSYNKSSVSALANDWNIADRSFWRLKQFSISYSLPASVLGNTLKGVKFIFSGSNLLTFSAMESKVIDPEIASLTSLPLFRVYNLGVKLDF